MSKHVKLDPREAFRGDDAAKMIRALAADVERRAEAGALKQRIKAEKYEYTNYPVMSVQITHVRLDPPLWRAETLEPLTDKTGAVSVQEVDRRHLIPELRNKCMGILLRDGYVKTVEEARQVMTRVTIEERGIILLKDSERHAFERRQ